MGAAVSVAVTKMPDSLDEATLKKICGPRFDKKKFDELKSADGFLAKTDLLEELAKPEYTVTTTKKIRTLRSTFDQLLNENLSNSQKVKFIRKSFKYNVPDGENDDESNPDTKDPEDTADPTVDVVGSSNHAEVPNIAQLGEVNDFLPLLTPS